MFDFWRWVLSRVKVKEPWICISNELLQWKALEPQVLVKKSLSKEEKGKKGKGRKKGNLLGSFGRIEQIQLQEKLFLYLSCRQLAVRLLFNVFFFFYSFDLKSLIGGGRNTNEVLVEVETNQHIFDLKGVLEVEQQSIQGNHLQSINPNPKLWPRDIILEEGRGNFCIGFGFYSNLFYYQLKENGFVNKQFEFFIELGI